MPLVTFIDEPNTTTPISASNLNNNFSEVWPIGSVYISVTSTNPSTIFGGTWEQIKGKFLVGIDDAVGETDFNVLGGTGGEKAVTLTTNQLPSHSHVNEYQGNYGVQSGGFYGVATNSGASGSNVRTKATGGGEAHNNLPPYLVVYMWKRTA